MNPGTALVVITGCCFGAFVRGATGFGGSLLWLSQEWAVDGEIYEKSVANHGNLWKIYGKSWESVENHWKILAKCGSSLSDTRIYSPANIVDIDI